MRTLLAEARHDEPMPASVADRLDRVLADLAATSPDVPGTAAHPDELAARRRRRARLLLAAAAVAVIGAATAGRLVDVGGDSSGDADTAASTAADTAGSGIAESGSAAGAGAARPAPVPTGAEPLEVRPDRFVADAGRVLASTPLAAAMDTGEPDAKRSSATSWFTCEPAAWGPGELVAVEYEGEPAVLALRDPVGETRVVELLECGTAQVLRSATVPID